MRLELTSVAFLKENWLDNLNECRSLCENFGWDFGVQLHNTAPAEQLQALLNENIPLSVHAPFNQQYNWSLASFKNMDDVFEDIDKNIKLFEKNNINMVVFHGGVMSDIRPLAFGKGRTYIECMTPLYRPELAMFPNKGLNRDFSDLTEFKERLEVLKNSLSILRDKYPKFTLAIETDFPSYTAMNMSIDTLLELNHPICLDTSHLWASCHLHDRNFHEEISKAMDSNKVAICHFHSSSYDSKTPKEFWNDGHLPLSNTNKEMDLKRAARIMYANKLDYWVLEITDATADDIKRLSDWI